ncbi:16S rRNA (cytidine(1402)-2'-O)-methyltransferase [Altererythrobacter sp. RZ02]|uniref:Ribosomal RNA small subunit methyltransferase I n=1 Tax=Pontixanthobacter rizhaonensis TaxID=2730337 RepID=A0A848QQJ7_9SPHN|nr:16S rRNA (cytidine(1402)-2'-O)-methyltransferase [Pontixanthobacter rizhaonensis]
MSHENAPEPLIPGLYIVATPIGNLGDVTIRAVDVLTRCDVVACEDSRVTGKLLKHLGIHKRLIRYNDHSDEKARSKLISSMRDQAVALVSDAGTPLISDPGYRLVQDARSADIAITSLPGACAAVVGLTLSGLPNDRFMFAGFLPTKEQARLAALESVKSIDATLVFYETGPRLVKALDAIQTVLPGREVSVARELTKLFEECRTGSPEELAAHYRMEPPKGEIVLLIGPPIPEVTSPQDADALLKLALEVDKPSQAAGKVAKETGLDRKTLYARALELRNE